MLSSKTEIQDKAGNSKNRKTRKKSRLRRLACWLVVDLAVAAVIVGLLLYRPGRYKPLANDSFKPGQVSPYLTHLSSEIYNGAQLREPFEVVVTQEAINDMIARGDWPKEYEGVMLYAPAAVLDAETIALMGTANVKGMEFVVTIELKPKIDERRLLNLEVAKLKVGAMNITPLAKMIAKKMYAEQVASVPVDKDAWQTRIAASLLNEEAFEPIFPTGDKDIRVRVEKAAVQKERLVLRLVPIL
jgi:hypothetical protein